MSSSEKRKFQVAPFFFRPLTIYYKAARDIFTALSGEAYEIEHLRPVSDGGLNAIHNLGVIPARLNAKKGNWIFSTSEAAAWFGIEVEIGGNVYRLGDLYGWRFIEMADHFKETFEGWPEFPLTHSSLSSGNLYASAHNLLASFQHTAVSVFQHIPQTFSASGDVLAHSSAAFTSFISHFAIPALPALLNHASTIMIGAVF